MSPTPNTTVLIRITRPSPTTDFRAASHNAPRERPDTGRGHQKPERVRTAAENLVGKHRHQHRERHRHQAQPRSSSISDRIGRNPKTYRQPFEELLHDAGLVARPADLPDVLHRQQRDDDSEVAEAVDAENTTPRRTPR